MRIHPPADLVSFNPPLFFAPRENPVFLEGSRAGRAQTEIWRRAYWMDPSRFEPVIGDPRSEKNGIIGLITCPFTGADPRLGFRVGLSDAAFQEAEFSALSTSRIELIADEGLYRIEFPLADIRPGEYRLRVVAFNLGGPNIAAAEFPLRIL